MSIPKRILLDTNFFVALRRRNPRAIDFFTDLRATQLVTCTVVKLEFAVGEYHLDPRQQKSIREMFALFETVAFDQKAADKALREASRLGIPLVTNPHKTSFDLMIASCAWASNRVLVTQNTRDFEAMPWVQTHDWSK